MTDIVSGVLKRTRRGMGLLLNPRQSFRPGPTEIFVPSMLMQKHELAEGATIIGPVRNTRMGKELVAVESVCGLPPEEFQVRTPYTDLIAVNPCNRFHLADTGETSMRMIDLFAPIGKGARGLIVSPPKAGKTTILEEIAKAIHADDPATRIIVLLLDERPEEVTYFRRAVEAEVLASSSDQSIREHVELAELTLSHIRTELECGRDVVVMVDSLTRMGRAFNLKDTRNRGGRTLSGGMGAGAMEIPRRFFGLARNIEDGGSITIIATALVDTGSRMDQVIFEEFKGTGNCEIILNRSIAEERIFPAIDLPASGTRKDALLHSPDDYQRITKLRRMLAEQNPKDAVNKMLKLFKKYPTNEELLQSIPLEN